MVSSAGSEAVDLAKSAGIVLDDWQCHVLGVGLGERVDGTWAALEVGIIVPRQNGKNEILIARELAGIVLFDDDLITHSAHRADTTLEQFRKMEQLAEEFDDFGRLVKRVSRVNGHEALELKGGRRIRFVSRQRNPGRGFSGSVVVLDEAFDLDPKAIGAMVPTLSTREMAQVWYASSPPQSNSKVLHGVRRRGRAHEGARLAYFEWANPPYVDPADRDAQYAVNPAMGRRISEDFIDAERQLMKDIPEEFLREVMGVAEEPVEAATAESKLPADKWQAITIPKTKAPHLNPGEVVLGFDVVDGWASISVAAGTLSRSYVECIEHHSGSSWLPGRLVQLVKKWKPPAVALDGGNGPAVAVLGEIREAFQLEGLDPDLVKPLTSAQYKAACGAFFTAVDALKVTRPRFAASEPDQLQTAGEKAVERRIGEAFVWDRRLTLVPLSPLVSVTCARSLLSEVALSTEMLTGSLMA